MFFFYKESKSKILSLGKGGGGLWVVGVARVSDLYTKNPI